MPVAAFTQQEGRMETDRPDQTESVAITKKGYLQGELGFNREYQDGLITFVHPTALWKYGIAKRIELRLITELITDPFIHPVSGEKDYATGLLPVQVGMKTALWQEKGLRPQASLITHLGFNRLASTRFRTAKLLPSFRFTFQNSLAPSIGLGYNLGAEWDGESDQPDWIYTLSPGFNLGKKWYAYVESWGSVRRNASPQHNLAGGLAVYLSDNWKLDFSGSTGIATSVKRSYVALGLSFRLPLRTIKH